MNAVVDPPLISKISPIQLRPYQEESIQAVKDHIEIGHKRLGLSLATGSGKTVYSPHRPNHNIVAHPIPGCLHPAH